MEIFYPVLFFIICITIAYILYSLVGISNKLAQFDEELDVLFGADDEECECFPCKNELPYRCELEIPLPIVESLRSKAPEKKAKAPKKGLTKK